ncbi:MAG: cell division topological specificity factor MinE [Myxococcales bacterium]|nr:cell division topological specificity factor MinE [Myxococcales bacterium]
MSLLDYFRRSRKKSASVAKDRLQILVARDRSARGAPDYLPLLRQELLAVIAKYETIDLEQVSVSLDRSSGCEVLELNIVLPDAPTLAAAKREARHAGAVTTPTLRV